MSAAAKIPRRGAVAVDASTADLTPGLRRRVLQIAAGNPLALLELPNALRLDDARIDGISSVTLSLTSRLERAFAEQASGLPAQTRDLFALGCCGRTRLGCRAASRCVPAPRG
jgi:uncharacterized membrane-anchored protein